MSRCLTMRRAINKWLRVQIWQILFALEFRRRTCTPLKASWDYGRASLENFDYDLDDVGSPDDAVSEELANWHD